MSFTDIVFCWSELLQNTIVTAEHCNGKDQILTATDTLQQTALHFVRVLSERAKLFANGAQFDTALRDAKAIITMLPRSGLGYLCTGDVYCQQGRYAAAIAIYDNGLKAVPESDEYYQLLQQHQLTAINNNSKRIDFISRLPWDVVVTNIIPRLEPMLDSKEPYGPLYVSRAWQERVLKQPEGLQFNFGTEKETLGKGHAQLVRFAPYVQRLKGEVTELGLEELFSRANFSNLKQLKITSKGNTPRRPLLNGLELIARSLTHLEIADCYSIQFRDILESCPNLVSIIMADMDAVMPSSSSIRYPKVTHLALYCLPDSSMEYDNMVDILSRFPSLLVLEITSDPDSRLLPLLHKYCPDIRMLYYGISSPYFDENAMKMHPKQKGLTTARLRTNEFFAQDHVIQFLHLHRHTLEKLDIRGGIIKEDDAFWELSNGKIIKTDQGRHASLHPDDDPSETRTLLTRLVDLSLLEIEHPLAVPFIQWMILNAPNLKSIQLDESDFEIDITSTLIQSKHLSKLEIIDVMADDDVDNDDNGIQQFLEYHIALGERSTLEHVIIRMEWSCDMSHVPWIPLLSRLKRLKNLELLADIITSSCKSMLKELADGCPALEKLTFGANGCRAVEGLIVPLYQIPNLKCIKIGAASVSDMDLIALTAFPRLERLCLKRTVADRVRSTYSYCKPKIVIEE